MQVCLPENYMELQTFRDSGFQLPLHFASPNKRMRMTTAERSISQDMKELEHCLPMLVSDDYYTKPSLEDMALRESTDPGYCNHVEDFTVGRLGYGYVKFLGKTDVRRLNLDEIVKLRRHEIAVYEDETSKPAVGEGLNKPAEVTLFLRLGFVDITQEKLGKIVQRLRLIADRQGADFISYDIVTCEWKFRVQHFSRFGLNDEEEEDMVMDDADAMDESRELNGVGGGDESAEGFDADLTGTELAHSLPAHLGLDPVKMKEMKMLMFPVNNSEDDNENGYPSHEKMRSHGRQTKSPIQHSSSRQTYRQSAAPIRKTPLALLEYSTSNFDQSTSGTVLMAQENKGLPMRAAKVDGFTLNSKCDTPVAKNHSCNIVDAGLFMGRSFRVGWGPNGILIHSGTPINGNERQGILSSVLSVEKVAIDKVTRDENNKVKEDAAELFFDTVLDLHKSLNHEAANVDVGSFSLSLQKVVFDRLTLPAICRQYRELVEKRLELPGLPASARLSLNHHVVVWELIKVLFSERETSGQSADMEVNEEEDMMQDSKVTPPQIDDDALPLVRRAEFSYWLQESVYHRVQEDLSCLDDSNYLEQIFLLLTGKQLDAAVELAVSKGDVRLACLLSQAGGSNMNRSDIARQLNLWRMNGMDFNFVERERINLYELLAGNIQGALDGRQIDWKRFLGLLMWYELPPGTHLGEIFCTYHKQAAERKAPYPVPIYIDEGPLDETSDGSDGGPCDIAYHLMLLHAGKANGLGDIKEMLSAFASTNDPLDYHMIWHQRAVLEAINVFSSDDLHLLDIGYVSQLLCLGQCHWAIYVALHMAYREDFPHLHFKLIKEILFQYCETWSTEEKQRRFIEDLGVPSMWMHEAMAVYHSYVGDLPKALEHFIESKNWQKAHSIFVTSVAHTMFLAGGHSEVWRLATSMDEHKSEIGDWDLGAGIYITFYLLRSSLKDEDDAITKLDSTESKVDSCRKFFGILNKSLEVLGSKLTIDARVAYSKMAEEIGTLLLSKSEDSIGETQLQCFDTLASAPVPEDLRSCHLQDAISLFTSFLAEEISS